MRIRKHPPRVSNVGGESSSGAQRTTDPGSQEQSQSELALSSREVKDSPTAEEERQHQQQQQQQEQRPALVPAAAAAAAGARGIERVDSTPRSAFTWLDKLWHAKGFTELEPYSNVEDFVSSLTKRDELRPRGHSEEIVEGGDLRRLVGGVDLDFRLLLQSDASLPANAMANISTDNLPPSQERLLEKQKGEDPRLKPSSYWGHEARNTSSWRQWEVERSLYHGESSGKRSEHIVAGTSSKNPLNYEISDVSCQPAAGEAAAVLEQHQRRHVGDYPPSVVAKSVGTRYGAPFQIASSIQDPRTESGSQRRSGRKRRISSSTDTEQDVRPAPPLSPDHPAQQVKDSLEFSLYNVLLRAGRAGLTAREAMSDIVEQRLAGVEAEGAVQSSRRIGKLLRNSPYYMEVGEGKFALCTAVIDSDSTIARVQVPPLQEEQEEEVVEEEEESQQSYRSEKESESISTADEQAPAPAGAAAVTKKRKRAVTVPEADQTELVVRSKPVRTGRPKKLKYMKQENAENLGNQCNRTDGKGWVCPLLAKPGYQLCDHHLNKLRCKPGSRSKKKKLMKMAAEAEAAAAAAAAAVVVEGEASTREDVPHPVDTARHELTTP